MVAFGRSDFTSHDETLNDGTSIDVQVRLSRTGSTQLFIGIYSPLGRKKVFDSRLEESEHCIDMGRRKGSPSRNDGNVSSR